MPDLYDQIIVRTRARAPGVLKQTLAAATDTIKHDDLVWLTNGTGGLLTMTSTPIMTDGRDGDQALLVNISAQSIALRDQGTLANSGLRLQAATRTLATRQSLKLIYSTVVGDWLELFYSAVI
jgi:hypothetical protein